MTKINFTNRQIVIRFINLMILPMQLFNHLNISRGKLVTVLTNCTNETQLTFMFHSKEAKYKIKN